MPQNILRKLDYQSMITKQHFYFICLLLQYFIERLYIALGHECVNKMCVTLKSFIMCIYVIANLENSSVQQTVLIYPIPCFYCEIVFKSDKPILGATVAKEYSCVCVCLSHLSRKKVEVFPNAAVLRLLSF